MKNKSYTLKHQKFVEEYFRNGFNQVQAYKTAFETDNYQFAAFAAGRLLSHPLVAEKIAKYRADMAREALVSQAEVLRELALMFRCDPADVCNEDGSIKTMHEIPEFVRKNIASYKTRHFKDYFTVEVKFLDKQSTIDKLMKHLGSYEADNLQRARAVTERLEDMTDLQVAELASKLTEFLRPADAVTKH